MKSNKLYKAVAALSIAALQGSVTADALALPVVAMSAETSHNPRHVRFDTDSGAIGIDNRCTACISHVAEDFEGPLVDSGRTIRGFGGSRTTNIKTGTLRWSWEDGLGERHTFLIPKSYYVPAGGVRLLSPQHWAQSQSPQRRGYGCYTDGDSTTLYWNDKQNSLVVPLGTQDNVSTFRLAPGFTNYCAFCVKAEVDPATEHIDPIIAEPAAVISDDEQEDSDDDEPENIYSDEDDTGTIEVKWDRQTPIDVEFDIQTDTASTPATIVEEEEDIQTSNTANAKKIIPWIWV